MSRPKMLHIRRWLDPVVLVELFALSNIAFLAVDIYVAHRINDFGHRAEWAPIIFSAVATLALLITMLLDGLHPALRGTEQSGPRGARQRFARRLGLAVAIGSIAMGIAGLLFHLDSQFFRSATLKNLVYTAPFAAPLAYAGVGFLLLLDRMVDARSVEWARWVTLFALGGFVGNFALTLADHAQDGFYRPEEWIGVIGTSLAIGGLTAVFLVYDNRPLLWLCGFLMLTQVGVGLLGTYLHVQANLAVPLGSLWQKFLYGAPVFAPLLFADLAVLGLLALWALARAQNDSVNDLVRDQQAIDER